MYMCIMYIYIYICRERDRYRYIMAIHVTYRVSGAPLSSRSGVAAPSRASCSSRSNNNK